VIAFVHESVCLEGIRGLLHLNPISFRDESEVLAALPRLLKQWEVASPSGIQLKLESSRKRVEQEHRIRDVGVFVENNSNNRILNFTGEVCIPRGLLMHWSANYFGEVRSPNSKSRCFRFSEDGHGPISPHEEKLVFRTPYCFECAVQQTGDDSRIGSLLVSESRVEAKLWVDGRQYSASATIEELEKDAAKRGQ
jgi:hypothetical protein